MSDKQQYDNTNKGVLLRNHKPKSDKSPPYTGHANIGGVEVWVSAWVKETKAGDKYFSLSFQPRGELQDDSPQTRQPVSDDDVPF